MRLVAPSPHRGRRLFIMLLVALLILAGAAIYNVVQSRTVPAPAGERPRRSINPSTQGLIAKYQDDLRRNPENSYAYAQLGLAYLQRVRETADAALYAQAETAFQEALARDPQQLDALIGQGILALARHDFRGALDWAERAQEVTPYRAEILGIRVDAQVELGRYEEAVATAQEMVDLKPGLPAYSRVSYVRELHGNPAGAIEAMQAAVDAGVPGKEATLWAQYQLGTLYFENGQWEEAEETYRAALRARPGYVYARAGLAHLQAARGNVDDAITTYEEIVERLPLPEFVIDLGDLYTVAGQPQLAQTQYDLVRAMQQMNADAGMNVDLELALFEADYGADPAQALAQARAAYAQRPSIHAADVLAWTLYQNGAYAEAWQYSQEALRLGTKDALIHYHAGMIAHRLGDTAAARTHLEQAVAINPAFSIRYAAEAERLLTSLGKNNGEWGIR